MKTLLLLFVFLFTTSVNSQNCTVKSFKKKRDVKKIIKLIDNKNYNEAKEIIKGSKEHAVFNALRAEIYWLEGDNEKAKKYANEVLYLCDEQFPVVYYILAEISFQEKDFVSSYNHLEKSIKYGLDRKYYKNAETFMPIAKELATIINNPVKYDPKILTGISTIYDEYLPTISPDQEYILFTRRFLKKRD